jgi:uncharacterized protein YoaH (UPF0181 family)
MHGWASLLLGGLLAISAAGSSAADKRYSPAKCERIEKQIRRIHSRMRAGYSAGQGVRLEARLRELKRQRRQYCR